MVIQLSIALQLNGHILITLKPNLMFYNVKDWSKALSTQPTNIILFGSWYLIIVVATSLSFLNVILNGLKHETSRGWNACEVCEGRVIMSKPKAIACFRAFSVTCDP